MNSAWSSHGQMGSLQLSWGHIEFCPHSPCLTKNYEDLYNVLGKQGAGGGFYKGPAHSGIYKGFLRKSIISGLPPCSKITLVTLYPSSAISLGLHLKVKPRNSNGWFCNWTYLPYEQGLKETPTPIIFISDNDKKYCTRFLMNKNKGVITYNNSTLVIFPRQADRR